MLAEVEVNHNDVIGWYGLSDCATCSGGPACRDVLRSRVIPIMNYDGWPTCPIRLTKSPQWQTVIRVYNARQVSPLARWPFGFAAWIVDALSELDAAFNRKKAADMKAARGGSRGRR